MHQHDEIQPIRYGTPQCRLTRIDGGWNNIMGVDRRSQRAQKTPTPPDSPHTPNSQSKGNQTQNALKDKEYHERTRKVYTRLFFYLFTLLYRAMRRFVAGR